MCRSAIDDDAHVWRRSRTDSMRSEHSGTRVLAVGALTEHLTGSGARLTIEKRQTNQVELGVAVCRQSNWSFVWPDPSRGAAR